MIVHEQLAGQGDNVQWMPAHGSQDQIGQKVCSDGAVVDDSRRAANQIVDLLAKEAADTVRILAEARRWLRVSFSVLSVFVR